MTGASSGIGEAMARQLVAEGTAVVAVARREDRLRALPGDVASTRELREHMIAPLVPGHAWVTGLAALWVYGMCPAPPAIDLAARRGAHRTEPQPGSPPLVFRTGKLLGFEQAARGPNLAPAARACIDALAHSRPADALHATVVALRRGVTTAEELADAAAAIPRRAAHRARVMGLVEALAAL